MRSLQTLFIAISLTLGSFQALAYVDGDGNINNTLTNYELNTRHYVLTYKELGGRKGELTRWKLKVSAEVGEELQTTILVQEFKTQAKAEQARKAYIQKLKKQGYEDPEDVPVSEDGDMADLPADMPAAAPAAGPSAKEGKNPIWHATNQWSWEWEMAYASWIRNYIDETFFQRYQIKTDCADVVIGLRWIFARIHGLPVANTLEGSRKMIGHMTESKLWSHLPTAANWYEDQRFLKALEYIKEQTYTGSLKFDSYPIAIKNGILTPGAHHLEFHSQGGHAMIVKNVEIGRSEAYVTLLESTLPAEVRRLNRKIYKYGIQPTYGTGFLRILWPVKDGNVWTFASPETHPGYSDEQYQPEFMGVQTLFAAAVSSQLRGVKNDKFNVNQFKVTLKMLKDKFNARAVTVVNGFEQCKVINCANPSLGWDEYSTPSFDGKLKDDVNSVLRTIQNQKDNRSVISAWNDFLKETLDLRFDRIKITMAQALSVIRDGKTNVDPRQSPYVRWGLR